MKFLRGNDVSGSDCQDKDEIKERDICHSSNLKNSNLITIITICLSISSLFLAFKAGQESTSLKNKEIDIIKQQNERNYNNDLRNFLAQYYDEIYGGDETTREIFLDIMIYTFPEDGIRKFFNESIAAAKTINDRQAWEDGIEKLDSIKQTETGNYSTKIYIQYSNKGQNAIVQKFVDFLSENGYSIAGSPELIKDGNIYNEIRYLYEDDKEYANAIKTIFDNFMNSNKIESDIKTRHIEGYENKALKGTIEIWMPKFE
jgi:hypothetical protein